MNTEVLNIKRILGQVRKAIQDYDMIHDGDRIAIHTFSPVTYLGRKDIHVIRPLIYAEEKEIKAFIRKRGLSIVHNPCQANGRTKRQFIKELLHDMSKDNREVKENIFGAIRRSGRDGWHD